jgi:hypothetical protein
MGFRKGRGGCAVISNGEALEIAEDKKADFLRVFR